MLWISSLKLQQAYSSAQLSFRSRQYVAWKQRRVNITVLCHHRSIQRIWMCKNSHPEHDCHLTTAHHQDHGQVECQGGRSYKYSESDTVMSFPGSDATMSFAAPTLHDPSFSLLSVLPCTNSINPRNSSHPPRRFSFTTIASICARVRARYMLDREARPSDSPITESKPIATTKSRSKPSKCWIASSTKHSPSENSEVRETRVEPFAADSMRNLRPVSLFHIGCSEGGWVVQARRENMRETLTFPGCARCKDISENQNVALAMVHNLRTQQTVDSMVTISYTDTWFEGPFAGQSCTAYGLQGYAASGALLSLIKISKQKGLWDNVICY